MFFKLNPDGYFLVSFPELKEYRLFIIWRLFCCGCLFILYFLIY